MAQEHNLAVLFPGIGYNFDRPLMHFAKEQALQYGYEVIPVGYTGFPKKIRGDQEKMQESLRIATSQAEEILQAVVWENYQQIIFYSKSIGTIVAAEYAKRHHIAANQAFFTPFPETFAPFASADAGRPFQMIAFHAQTDPWMDDQQVIETAARAGVPMEVFPRGNHSLETGDTLEDIRILEDVFQKTQKLIPASRQTR